MSDREPPLSVPSKGGSSAPAVQGEHATAMTFTEALATVEPEPEQENIFVAAQRGDLETIRRLIESGRAKATDRDDQNITPLHWAAINCQTATCRYLLEQGAEVDALGGDLVATPMQWAARNGYLYIIQLLIAHNADPTIKDSQGYNTLHLVTHSSSVMPLLYLLQQPISVDSVDAQGHTSLMWAAYQGDALSVDLLLKHGAGVNTRDEAGLTPLHWAVVRGNKLCIRHLVERGADIGAKEDNGKTARDMAQELKSLGAYKRALEEAGVEEDGTRKKKLLSERNTRAAILLLPLVFFYLIFTTLSVLPWYTGLLVAAAEFFGMHHIVSRVLLNHSSYADNVTQSPYFSGIILGSMFWVAWCWFTRLVYNTPGHVLWNFTFAVSFLFCAYNFFRAITLDPGTCPKPMNDAELKEIIEELASGGRLNGQTFCVSCMARKPLRSKHCRVCEKCVGRHDHHCPWVWNCVGVNNHRQFVVFVTTLVSGILAFDFLVYYYLSGLDLSGTPSASCLFPEDVCLATAHDSFLFAVTAWATVQLSWTSVLLLGQFYQVGRQMTTLEVSNLGRYGFMGGRGGMSLAGQDGHQHSHHEHGESDSGTSPSVHSGHHHHAKRGICGGATDSFLKLLGLDRFTKGKAVDGMARASKAANPFDMGCLANCRDFWTRGRELGVEYERLYDVPVEGFKEAKRRREMEDGEIHLGGTSSSSRGKRKGLWSMSMGLGLGGRSREGYLPVRSDDAV